ncbi:MAG: septal ring lytic transglycosylase RlpA family protein [Devosia sp.]|nr:septal ring lytic transglycosylase RlpA family protein [Devosia sp.]
MGTALAACGGAGFGGSIKRGAFTSAEYGVAASPRVSANPNPPKGGGRFMIGKPYQVRGKWYTPAEDPNYLATGKASWYGADFHGRQTANGEIFSANGLTAAHATLPIPSYVRVTNLQNGRSIVVRINDRGPYVAGRVIDLSWRAATILGYIDNGSTDVKVEFVAKAPLEGDDTRALLATYQGDGVVLPGGDTRLAMGRSTLMDKAGSLVTSIFSYADTTPAEQGATVATAFDAVTAMAAQAPELDAWVASVDAGQRAVDIPLGVFRDPAGIDRVASAFAFLGAVDVGQVMVNGQPATSLTLSQLKPGVGLDDVALMARELGLTGVSL